ncbi:hypothetical protein BZL29_8571 [Mycobacterium kansasii]|uniref:Uncharacterized protein n=1 Tax=Mycobacterium kansasii TaxID=1768 RepID=A0A1V3W970_MYCKA|nr:hypothetical protein BZL29_8571 [Mycobacterium kansasii]
MIPEHRRHVLAPHLLIDAFVAAIAGAFCPNRFDITNCTNTFRWPPPPPGESWPRVRSQGATTAWACPAAAAA